MAQTRVTLPFLQKLFEKSNPNVVLKEFLEEPGSGRGDNYTALLYRVKLKGHILSRQNNSEFRRPWEKSIVYKCLPENTTRREAFKSDVLFRNEVSFYTRVLPSFIKFQESKKDVSTKHFNAVPKCYLAENDIIILEDLCEPGYSMTDRKQGLNYVQIMSVLTELAKFHAISLAMKILHPGEFYSLIGGKYGIREGMFIKENQEWYREYYAHAAKNALEMVREEFAGNQMYINKFESFVNDSFFQKMINIVSYTEPLSVLCHGDCWTNNILFKPSETNESLQVCFIDFQLCRYGSLALDLANLIYCCTRLKLRDACLHTLLKTYHNVLHKSLTEYLQNTEYESHELLNKEYSLDLLINEFRRCGLFGLGLAIDMIPISTCDSEQAPNMYEEENDTSQNFPVATSNELCKTKMTNLVKELVDNGILK